MGLAQEGWRNHPQPAGGLRHLERHERPGPGERPPAPGAVQRPARLPLRGAGRDGGILGADDVQPVLIEGPHADPLDGIGPPQHLDDRACQRGAALLHLDDDPDPRECTQDLLEARDADAGAAKRMGAVHGEAESGVDARELIGGQGAHRTRAVRGPLQRGIVDHDRHPVTRQVHVALDPVAAERDAAGEGGHRVLRREPRAAAMGEDQPVPAREGMNATRHQRHAS